MKNCPNCGAPIDPDKYRCGYCGTYYFDFTSFDLTGKAPYYVKFKTPMGVVTTLANPELKTIEMSNNETSCVDGLGRKIISFITNRSCDLEVTFHSRPDHNNNLFTLETER